MRLSKYIAAATVLTVFTVFMFFAATATAQEDVVVGPISENEYFPDMMKKKPDCNTAYNEYLVMAKPLKACQDLYDAKVHLAAEDAVAKNLSGIKTRKAEKLRVQAMEATGAYREQVRIFKSHCPPMSQQVKLRKKLHKKHKAVCSSCHKKWPGSIGHADCN